MAADIDAGPVVDEGGTATALTGKSAAKDVVESNVPSATVVDQMEAFEFISRPVMQSSER